MTQFVAHVRLAAVVVRSVLVNAKIVAFSSVDTFLIGYNYSITFSWKIYLAMTRILGSSSIHLPKPFALQWRCDAPVANAAKPTSRRRENEKHDTFIVLVINCLSIQTANSIYTENHFTLTNGFSYFDVQAFFGIRSSWDVNNIETLYEYVDSNVFRVFLVTWIC